VGALKTGGFGRVLAGGGTIIGTRR